MEQFLGNTPGTFLFLTFAMFAPLAIVTGQGVARSWQPWWLVAIYCTMLAAVERFTDYSLANGELLAAGGFVLAVILLSAIGLLAWRATMAAMMVRQYPWMYERTGLLGWKSKSQS